MSTTQLQQSYNTLQQAYQAYKEAEHEYYTLKDTTLINKWNELNQLILSNPSLINQVQLRTVFGTIAECRITKEGARGEDDAVIHWYDRGEEIESPIGMIEIEDIDKELERLGGDNDTEDR